MKDAVNASTLAEFSWDGLGYPGRAGKDSTLWIGTQGAYTPCHQDSYGYNLVAQLYGTKRWILFPPDQSELLYPSRVPYEESSTYSGLNFQALTANSAEQLSALGRTTPHLVELQPGEVLYVPRHWWHAVAHTTFAISVNSWMELEE